MLKRATKRALSCGALNQPLPGTEATQLPFLYPAFLATRPLSRKAAHNEQNRRELAPRPVRLRPSPSLSTTGAHQHRHLASAATSVAYDYDLDQDDFIPFEDLPVDRTLEGEAKHQPLASAAPSGFAPSASPLILHDAPTTISGKFKVVNAISGDVNEIHQTLHACLQVGRLERAAALVRRLGQIYKPDAPGLIAAHNDYIREITLKIVRTKDQKLLQNLQHWFEQVLQPLCIVPTAATYALMIQACKHGEKKKQADRSIKKYADIAKEAGLGDETMELVSSLEASAQALKQFKAPEQNSRTYDTQALHVDGLQAFSGDKPELRATTQKGLGLSTLKKSLLTLGEGEGEQNSGSRFVKTADGFQKRLFPEERQRMIERNTLQAALARWQEEDAHLKSLGIVNVLSSSSLGAIMWNWHEKLVPALRTELQKANAAEDPTQRKKGDERRLSWGPYLQTVAPERLSVLAILTCIKLITLDSSDQRGTKSMYVMKAIGSAVHEEASNLRAKSSQSSLQWRALSRKPLYKKAGQPSKKATIPAPISSNMNESNPGEDFEQMRWPSSVKVQIGAVLLSQLMDVAKVEVCRPDPETQEELREEQSAFFHAYSYQGGKRIGMVRMNPDMKERMLQAPVGPSFAKHHPMLCVPRRWVGFKEGGFLEQAIPIVRLDSDDLQSRRYAISACENGDMSQVFAGLNVLAKTPWTINRAVFNVMVEAWNSGEAVAKIPPENPTANIPVEPPESAPIAERLKWLRKMKEAENQKNGLKGQRIFQNLQLEVARAFLGETFYFPHNVDFRGRAYPMAPFLNHMGADNARGILQFAERRILGPNGLWWLKIHLANMFGYDKASFQERFEFTEKNIPNVVDSAKNSLNGSRWWLTAEDPWQCLAACKELAAALQLDDPSTFRSSLAIHQDGTCNGLQHYAALGGDGAGAKQVNLEPGDRPSDIYTAVAEVVKAEVRNDAAMGNALAASLDGKATRKVVKQTVMTNVYGVTYVGAKAQVRKQLDTILNACPDSTTINRDLAAGYLTKKIFGALGEMFNGAVDIQRWFGDCAGRICRSISPFQIEAIKKEQQNIPMPSMFKRTRTQLKSASKFDPHAFTTGVIWTTPLKMPVVQSYSKSKSRRVDTSLQQVTIKNPSITDPIDRAKQLQAFPPNFIHSLDGTHMFLTALDCDRIGLTFAAVHDSFWTHAGDVETLNKITRDAFIKLHSENIIERLRAEFETRYAGHMQLASVVAQSQVGEKIRAWRRAQGHAEVNIKKSPAQTTELLLEMRRLELLASERAEERAEGEKMVTPGSIYNEFSADESLLAPPSEMPVVLGRKVVPEVSLKAEQSSRVRNAKKISLGVSDSTVAGANRVEGEEEEGPAVSKTMDASAIPFEASTEFQEDDFDASWIRETEDRPPRNRKGEAKTHLWLPLTFPPIPKKGEFDVSRLRDSQYFFS